MSEYVKLEVGNMYSFSTVCPDVVGTKFFGEEVRCIGCLREVTPALIAVGIDIGKVYETINYVNRYMGIMDIPLQDVVVVVVCSNSIYRCVPLVAIDPFTVIVDKSEVTTILSALLPTTLEAILLKNGYTGFGIRNVNDGVNISALEIHVTQREKDVLTYILKDYTV